VEVVAFRHAVQRRAANIVKDPRFLRITPAQLLFLCSLEQLDVSECVLWRQCLAWAQLRVQNNAQDNGGGGGNDASSSSSSNENKEYKELGAALRRELAAVLPHLSLLQLSSMELASYVANANVFTPEEMIAIFSHKAKMGKTDAEAAAVAAPSPPLACSSKLRKRFSTQHSHTLMAQLKQPLKLRTGERSMRQLMQNRMNANQHWAAWQQQPQLQPLQQLQEPQLDDIPEPRAKRRQLYKK
jgi:hypothetical protein